MAKQQLHTVIIDYYGIKIECDYDDDFDVKAKRLINPDDLHELLEQAVSNPNIHDEIELLVSEAHSEDDGEDGDWLRDLRQGR